MPHEPTGLEHVTPVRITSTSATERGGFRKCRRQWFLTVVHRLDGNEGNVNFFLGNTYHAGLEAYYKAQMAGVPLLERELAALDAYQDRFDLEMARVKDQLGFLFSVGEPAFRDAGELGFEMLQNYLERERVEPMFDRVIAVEFRVNVKIVHPVTGRKTGELSVQADVVGEKDGELAVGDHKTASRVMPSAHLDLDDQLTAEVFSWWQATGDFPDKAIYNVSYKRRYVKPRRLKDKKGVPVLSKAANKMVTYGTYREAIAELEPLGLNKGDYVDILAELKRKEESGEDALFRREATFRTPGQMAAFKRDLFQEFRDMKEVAAHPERAYPNPTNDNCSRCPVRIICTTMQDDGDVSAVIQAGYIVGDPRR